MGDEHTGKAQAASDHPCCGVCGAVLLPHERALFHSGKGNLIQLHTTAGIVLVHLECAEKYTTTSELLQAVTNGKENLNYLE